MAGFLPGDAAVIEAGEKTGRLEVVFAELEAYYRELADARQRIIARSIYPLVILHLGAFLLAVPPAILQGGLSTFLAKSLPILVIFYLLCGLAWVGWRTARSSLAGNAAAARGLLAIPVLGGLLSDWTAWKFAGVLSLYVRAGGGLLKGFEVAGSGCENALLRQASIGTVAEVQAGRGLGDAVRSQAGWPELLERALEVGEHSGRLDEETQRASELYKQRTLAKFDAFSRWAPKILYIAIVLLMAWQAVAMISEVMNTVYSAAGLETE